MGWTIGEIEATKVSVKEELTKFSGTNQRAKKLEYLKERLSQLKDEAGETEDLIHFIYIMSYLIHTERLGEGMSPAIVRYCQLAETILERNGVTQLHSRNAFLASELYLAQSALQRRSGEHWQATWLQQVAFHFSKRNDREPRGVRALSTGIRLLRIGDGAYAMHSLVQAEKQLEDPAERLKARLGQLLCSRLTGHMLTDAHLFEDIYTIYKPNDRQALEIEWERTLRNCANGDDLTELMQLVQKRGTHYSAIYLLEAFLWSRASRSTTYQQKLPSFTYFSRQKNLNPRQHKGIFQCVRGIEQCYGSDHLATRLKNLGECLSLAPTLISIDRELLTWLSAARWLARNNLFGPARICLNQYIALSLKLSQGENRDVLSLAADLLDKSWFVEWE